MIGVALGCALLWAAWPARARVRSLVLHPSLFMLPALFAASFTYYVFPHLAHAGFTCFVVLAAGASLLERRQVTGGIGVRHPVDDRSFVLAGLLVAWLVLRDIASAAPAPAPLLGLASGWLILVGVRQASRAGVFTASVVLWWSSTFVALCLITGGLLGREWIDCRYEFGKCTAVGRLYVGIFNSENTLAFFAALSVTYVLAARSRRWIAHLTVATVIVLLTGSRTALVAAGTLPLLLAVVHLTAVRTRRGSDLFRPGRAASLCLAASIPALGIALVTFADGNELSLRGDLWAEARQIVGPTSLTGAGRHRYSELLDLGWFRGHYPHSQYLLLLFFGGLVAVALYSIWLGSLLAGARGTSRRGVAAASAPVLFTMVYGLTELTWNPVGVDPNLWTMAAVFATAAGGAVCRRSVGSRPDVLVEGH